MSTEGPRARLWFGAAGLLDGTRGWAARGPLACVELPAGDLAGSHTVRLAWALAHDAGARVLRACPGSAAPLRLPAGAPVFDGFAITGPLAAAVADGGLLTPLFVTVDSPAADGGSAAGRRLRTFSKVTSSTGEGLFLLTGDAPVTPAAHADDTADAAAARSPEDPDSAAAAEALRRHRAHFLRLNNAVWAYAKHFPGTEIEYKLTMRPGVDVHRLSIDLYRILHRAELGPFRPEFGNEYELCEIRNHLYEVAGPLDERGYVSFIPMGGGAHLVRRKWFPEDALVRREEIFRDVTVHGGFEEYIADTFKVAATAHPPFTRVRYDLNVESMRTGHVYGVFFDRCEADGHPGRLLQQCEVEYLRTRSVAGVENPSVQEELHALKDAVAGFLRTSGIPFEESHLSKLSWLRSLTAPA